MPNGLVLKNKKYSIQTGSHIQYKCCSILMRYHRPCVEKINVASFLYTLLYQRLMLPIGSISVILSDTTGGTE